MAVGLVIKSTGSWQTIKTEDNDFLECKIKGKLKIGNIVTTNPVAVGDKVEYKIIDKERIGIISKIFPRKNYIIRRSINLSRQAHIIAANVDQAFLIITIVNPQTNTQFIDRFLVSAEAYSIPVIIVINKSDIYNNSQKAELKKLVSVYENIGYQCVIISSLKKINTEIIRNLCVDKISVFSGNSGVGKSTLINILDPEKQLRTAEISDFHLTGKHTTTFSEMVQLHTGGYIIDTPGIKGFGIIDIEKNELYHFFPEIFKISKKCRYHNCTHINEPDCAVKGAVEDNIISESRYQNYYNMYYDDDSKYRQSIKSGK
ncbi:ribosome small subunit-dependent GTPase A [Bacteroidota bacterium]